MERVASLVDGSVELTVKASPQWVGTVRLLVASAGRIFGVDEESLADLKMAVSEACSEALEAGGDDPMRIVLKGRGGVMEVEVLASSRSPSQDGGAQQSLRTSVIEALFPDVSFSEPEAPFRVHFSLQRTR